MSDITLQLQILGTMLLAMVLGGVVSFEREIANKPAGLRTHMLVAGAAALLTGLGRLFGPQYGMDETIIRIDPLRIIEAVVAGVAFLGAGTIIRSRSEGEKGVEGLTTAASLLMVGALGIGVALYQFVLTIGATVLLLLTLRVLSLVDKRVEENEK